MYLANSDRKSTSAKRVSSLSFTCFLLLMTQMALDYVGVVAVQMTAIALKHASNPQAISEYGVSV
jgi:hypothetical protein